jgi:hypothetical protein
VQGAGIHRNPTTTPDGAKFIYGHLWVTICAVVRHKLWATVGLPLLAKMYVRAKDIVKLPTENLIGFQDKLQQAAELVKWASECCKRPWGQKKSAVCDRSDSPWDDQFRRPSYADKCSRLRQEVLKRTFFETFGHSRKNRKIARQFYKLLKLAA